MNYRHLYHAGNFADVMKHALLVRLARGLQRKPKGVLFLDTHAGRGAYELALAAKGDSLERAPEYPEGIGRLWSRPDLPADLADYVALVREFDRAGPAAPGDESHCRRYPGSPWLLKLLAREQDRLALCELHPEEFLALRGEFGRARGVSVHEMDGYVALRAMLPPPERRALVLVDPPYEAQEEWTRVAAALREGLGRFPSGVYAVWYPLTERAGAAEFFEHLRTLRLPPTLVAELTVEPESTGLKGCGLLIVNPGFDREADSVLQALAQLLRRASAAGATLRWLVPE